MYLSKSKTARTPLPDQDDFAAIFYRIEQYPDAQESRDVERILRLLSRLESSPKDVKRASLLELQRALRPYLWRYLVVDSGDRGIAAVLMSAQDRKGGWEHDAIRTALSLVEHGQLWRLFECETCKELGFAPYKRQRFCKKAKCKSAAEYADLAKRAKKLKKVRENRKTRKDLGNSAKESVGFKKAMSRRAKA